MKTSTHYLRCGLLFLLIFSSFKWVMADAPPHAATTAPKALTSCRPTFSSCFTGGLNSFTVNGITLSNATGCSTGYASYTAVTTNVAPGQPYLFAGTFTNSGYSNRVTIWADLNRDGTFSTTEVVFLSPTTVTTSSFSGSLTIPPNTATGPVDVRVVVAYSDIPTSSSACGSYSYGEAEDYVLNVIAPIAYNPTTTNIANTSAVLAWNNLGTASSYEVQWRPQTTPASAYTTISGITSTTYALTGLEIGAYEWQMRPTSGIYVGPVSFTTTSCSTPDYFYVNGIGSVSVQYLYWSSVSESAYPNKTFEVQLQVTGAGSWSTVYTGTNNSTPKISGLTPQTPYTWRVRASCSLFSAPQTFTTTGCNTPSVSHNAAYNSVRIQWSDNENTAYNIQYRPLGSGSWTTITSLTGNQTYRVTGLTGNTVYEYGINKICTSSVSSTYSVPQTFTTACSVPSINSAYGIAHNSALLSWSDSDPEGLIYTIQHRPTGGTWTTVSSWGTTSYNLTGLTTNTTYQWAVSKVCTSTISSPYSAPQTFTTVCNPLLYPSTTQLLPTSAVLSWYNFTPGVPPADVQLQWRPTSQSVVSWTTIDNIPGFYAFNTATYTLIGLTNNTAYQWQARASCGTGVYSSFTSPSSFTTQSCQQPYNLNTSIGINRATLSWSTAGGDYPGLNFTVQYRPASLSATTSDWISVSGITSSDYSLTGLESNTAYQWQASKACTPTESSGFSNSATFTTRPCSNAVSNLRAGSITFGSAYIFWDDNSGNTYTVQWRPKTSPATAWNTIANAVSSRYTSASYWVTGLTGNTGYEFQVALACTPSQSTTYTAPYSFTTLNCTLPTSLNTYGIGINRATLYWSTAGGSYPGQNFTVQYRPASLSATTSGWTSVSGITSSTYSLTGLDVNTAYQWQVSQICSATESSGFAAPITFTTLPCSNQVYGLNVSNQTYASAQLNWSESATNTYNVQWRPQTLPAANWNTIANAVTSSGGSYTLTGLNTSTAYEYQVAVACTPSVSSTYVGPSSFTTTACSNLATGLAATGTTFSAANLTWTGPNFVSYTLRFRPTGTTAWTDVSGIMTKPYTLTGLTTSTVYEAQIASVCSGATTVYGLIYSFTTTGTNTCPVMYTVKNGSWNDPTVWICNRVPLATDAVQVRHNVTIPGSYLAYSLRVSFWAGGKVSYGLGARLVLGQ
jgi:GEVED domain/Fibronectin type III domain